MRVINDLRIKHESAVMLFVEVGALWSCSHRPKLKTGTAKMIVGQPQYAIFYK